MKARVLRTDQIIEVEYLGKLGKFSKIFCDIQSGIEYTEKDIVFCFDFNSSVCTDRHQSERLLALGLRKETADMAWLRGHEKPVVLSNTFNDKEYGCIPAWSLDRQREMLNKSGVTISFVERDTSIIVERYGVFQNVCEIWDNVYDNICDAYEWLIKEGYFNKEYLV